MLTENHLEMGEYEGKNGYPHTKALFPLNLNKREGENIFSGCTLLLLIIYSEERGNARDRAPGLLETQI